MTGSSDHPPVFLGVDVGTGSARAGVFAADGRMLGTGKREIRIWREGVMAEQSSDDIWNAVCVAVREALEAADVPAGAVAGIGFDATCSLVAVSDDGTPVSVSPSGDPARNIIVWMDQRAAAQAARINATGHRVLDYVGGSISPEMETPKLLWLKENLPDTYAGAGHFMDLADYLTWRATGDLSRSSCTVTCKWTYLAHEGAFDASYFRQVGLSDLCDGDFARIGPRVVAPGQALGSGLTETAAGALGLVAGIPVAAGMIDAHAGGVGTVGAKGAPAQTRMAYVFGTSACTMTSSSRETIVPGVWGPYYGAMLPDHWLIEGGQSAAGEAIAHLVRMHPHYPATEAAARDRGLSVTDYLLAEAAARIDRPEDAGHLAGDVIVVPDFLGNRAPLSDPSARAIIAGLDLRRDLASHIALYIAGLCGIGYGLRQILDAQAACGVAPDTVVISGGAGASALVKQVLADAAGITTAEPTSPEPVLLGSAMLGAVAAGHFDTLATAMAEMSSLDRRFTPAAGATREMQARRYRRFTALQAAARTPDGRSA
ncbi:FGGY-family carbohydrate kinase [Antarctobacter sp.]|uniref:FGGY-family carbohydrate kinase n=1 Tax=Antarctobacter sp. TaxID=1872577 RepID=UPI002B275697|nr:FGGY-family carbohydrate kinase [Antarctobacter sp.]